MLIMVKIREVRERTYAGDTKVSAALGVDGARLEQGLALRAARGGGAYKLRISFDVKVRHRLQVLTASGVALSGCLGRQTTREASGVGVGGGDSADRDGGGSKNGEDSRELHFEIEMKSKAAGY